MNIMKKNRVAAVIVTSLVVQVVHPCLNTIINNTNNTYKLAEITQENLSLKFTHNLPQDYIKDEQKARTLKPGERTSFGGHYLPRWAVAREEMTINGVPTGEWEIVLVVTQHECGPRGKEEKTLLLTDILKGELPGDYQPSYKFKFRKNPTVIADTSMNNSLLASNKNKYQLVSEIFAKFEAQIQEVMSQIAHDEKKIEAICPGATALLKNDIGETTVEKGKEEEAATTEQTPTKSVLQPNIQKSEQTNIAEAEPVNVTVKTPTPQSAAELKATPTPKVELPAKPQPAKPAPAAEDDGLNDDDRPCAACAA